MLALSGGCQLIKQIVLVITIVTIGMVPAHLNALVELLAEKGLLSKQEVLERVKRLQTQTQLRKRHNSCGNKGS